MRQTTVFDEIDTCLYFLDTIEEDREDYKRMWAHRPAALANKLEKLNERFVEWHERLVRLEKRAYRPES